MVSTTLDTPAWLRPVVYYYGGALFVVGLLSLTLGRFAHWTAAIPAVLGALVLGAGYGARQGFWSDGTAAIAALVVAAIAIFGSATALPNLPSALAGSPQIANPAGTISRGVTAIVSLAAAGVLAWQWLTHRNAASRG
jgi:hypothetical protein